MTTQADENDSQRSQEVRLVILGKTGTGKSSVGNILLGKDNFPVCCSMSSATMHTAFGEGQVNGRQLKVVDTPDLASLELTGDEAQRMVCEWKTMTSPYPHAIVLAVRCDVPYTPGEHALYRQLQRLWGGNSLSQRLVVGFTFGDRLDLPIGSALKTASKELQSVVMDANGRFVVFNSKATEDEKGRQVHEVLQIIDKLGEDIKKTEREKIYGLQMCPCGPV